MDIQRKAALVACSDPLSEKRLQEIHVLQRKLEEEGLETKPAGDFSGGAQDDPVRKAEHLNACFRDPETAYIFDVSGGELANSVLPYLDYDAVRNSRALFFGYSDLTTVINAIIAKTGRPAVNYQIRNILYDHADEQLRYLKQNILAGHIDPHDLEPEFLRGSRMEGRILGGNIRCFLKLAGTEYWPEMKDSILLLESYGGDVFRMMTALEQYRQMGVFEQVGGVLLGTFTKMERENLAPAMEELVMNYIPGNMPVARTRYVGHYSDARAVVLGEYCCIKA